MSDNNNNSQQLKVLLDKLNVSYGIIRSIVHIVNIYLEDITIDTNEEYLLMIQQLITLYDAIILLEDLNKNIAGFVDGGANLNNAVVPIGLEHEHNKYNEKEKKLHDIIQQFYALSIGIQSSVSYIILKKPCGTTAKELNKEECSSGKKDAAPKYSIECPGVKKDAAPKCCTTNEMIFRTLIYEYRKLNCNFQNLKTCMAQKTNITNCDSNAELQKYAVKCKEAIQIIRKETDGYNVELYEPIFELFDEPQKQVIDESKLYKDNQKLDMKIKELEPTPKKRKCATKKCAAEVSAMHLLKNKVVSLQAETEPMKEDSVSRHDSESNVDVSVNTDPIKYRQKQNKTEIVIVKESDNSVKAIPNSPSHNTLPSTIKKTQKQHLQSKNFKEINHTIVNNIETNPKKLTSKKNEAGRHEFSCELQNCKYAERNQPNSLDEEIAETSKTKQVESFTRSVSIIDSAEKRSPNHSHKSRTSLKPDKPARIKKDTREKSHSHSVSLRPEKLINENPTKDMQSDTYPNISIVNQDALTPVVWALTRVKISDNGAKIFEVLDVSPIPPGRYLYNAPNQIHLLGIQPGTS